MNHHPAPLLVVLSGPSGVGKDAVLARMKELGRPYHFTVTATTRPRRSSEQDGVDYVFLGMEEFQELQQRGGLLEWAQVYGHCYGVPRAQVADALGQGKDVIIKTDVQGATTLKRLVPEGVFIFLAPPSLENLEARLRRRGSESPADLALRLRTAQEEIEQIPLFTHVVVNEEERLDDAVAAIEGIITAEKRRVDRPRVEL